MLELQAISVRVVLELSAIAHVVARTPGRLGLRDVGVDVGAERSVSMAPKALRRGTSRLIRTTAKLVVRALASGSSLMRMFNSPTL